MERRKHSTRWWVGESFSPQILTAGFILTADWSNTDSWIHTDSWLESYWQLDSYRQLTGVILTAGFIPTADWSHTDSWFHKQIQLQWLSQSGRPPVKGSVALHPESSAVPLKNIWTVLPGLSIITSSWIEAIPSHWSANNDTDPFLGSSNTWPKSKAVDLSQTPANLWSRGGLFKILQKLYQLTSLFSWSQAHLSVTEVINFHPRETHIDTDTDSNWPEHYLRERHPVVRVVSNAC